MKTITRWTLLMVLLCVAMSGNVLAGGTKTVELQMHLVVTQPPPCTIADLAVEIGIEKTNAEEISWIKTGVPIVIDCTEDVTDYYKYLQLKIQGTTTTINNERVLQTSIPDLGIRLTGPVGTLFPLGDEGVKITIKPGRNDVDLYASLVKRFTYETLPEGEYTASATMVAEYL